LSRPKIIGIVGPPCSGKSTVARIFESLGGVWINADAIAKDQLDHPSVIKELIQVFGESIRQPDGRISRPAIADLVFGEDAESIKRLETLESIIHPRTRVAIASQIKQATADGASLVILDVPLLIESGWDSRCDEVWCLKIPPAQQAELLKSRGWDADELARRDRRQLPWKDKETTATRVIINDGTVDDLSKKVREIIDNLERTSNGGF
jgi:dephospho-CoA kinase